METIETYATEFRITYFGISGNFYHFQKLLR